MKKRYLLLIFLMAILSGFRPDRKKKIIFFGDSITLAGAGPGGFIGKIDSMLQKARLDHKYELIGSGVSGNKIYDLYLRLEEDVLARHPVAVVIWIGVNDVWHKEWSHTGTDADRFVAFYQAILNKLKDRHIRAYICTPAVICEKKNQANPQDEDLNVYADIIRTLAKENKCSIIDLRKGFLDYIQENNPENKGKGVLTYDGVHLNSAGNLFVAETMCKALLEGFIK